MIWLLGGLGALLLALGLAGDCVNWDLAHRPQPTQMSPMVLAPLLFDWLGLILLFLALKNSSWLLFASLAFCCCALHYVCLRGGLR